MFLLIMKSLPPDQRFELSYYSDYFYNRRKLLSKEKISEYRKKIRELTGDHKKTQLRWDLRKERRLFKALIENEEVNRLSVSKKRL